MCLCVCLHARALVDFHVRLNSCSLFLLSIALNSVWFYFADVKSVFCPNYWSEEHVSKQHMSAHLSVQCLWGVKLRDFLFSTRENKEHPLNNLIKLYFFVLNTHLKWTKCGRVCVFVSLFCWKTTLTKRKLMKLIQMCLEKEQFHSWIQLKRRYLRGRTLLITELKQLKGYRAVYTLQNCENKN